MTTALHPVGGWLALSVATAGGYTLTRRIYVWRNRP